MDAPRPLPEKAVQALRGLTARAAELAGGGRALLFALAPGSEPTAGAPLRAAAGFADAGAVRAAAGEIEPLVRALLSGGEPRRDAAPACLEAPGGMDLVPVGWDGRALGALVVGYPAAPPERAGAMLMQIAASAGLHLDHARLAAELAAAQSRPAADEDDPDQLLKLSEQLFAQDIELLRSNEKLGKIEKLKNDFIEKMSRELRTPLNNIIESIIAVIAGENEHLSEGALQSLRTALDEGTAFQRTLQNILDLWRIKQNELPVEIQEVNFAEVIDEAIFSVQDTLDGKPVAIEKEFEAALPKLRTDLAKVNQILFLLLDNAAKFTEKGRIVIAPRLEGNELVCEVRDTGIGICPDDHQLVFDEFFQVDDMASTRYRGAGLGLALVRDLLTLLEGEILVDGEAGRGTTMTFRIPVQPI